MNGAQKKLATRPMIGQILVDMGLLTSEELPAILRESAGRSRRLGEHLIDTGRITERDLALALAKQFDFKFIDLRGVEPTDEALDMIPYRIAKKFGILPISIDGHILKVGVFDPLVVFNIQKVKKIETGEYEALVGSESEIVRLIEVAYARHRQNEKATPPVSPTPSPVASAEVLKPLVFGSHESVEEHTNKILEQAIVHRASDIHFEPNENSMQIRERIDGILEKSIDVPGDLQAAVLSRIKILGQLDIAEKRMPQDGRFAYKYRGRDIDFRVSSLPTVRGEKIVLRILDKASMHLNFEDLGMDPAKIAKIKNAISHPHGLILVTGPTGSGKTTTVYSMLNYLNSIEKNIITVEDPVEYQFPMINQVHVNTKAGLTFASILKNVLRQDPDIIMVGEIRDQETAKIATQAAMTGHLVISTVHTNEAASAVTRMADLGVEPFVLSSSLLGVLSQRLVRRLCKHCKTQTTKLKDEASELEKKMLAELGQLYAPVGCTKCFNSGYSGREGIYEFLEPDRDIRKAISEGASIHQLEELLAKNGFADMRADGLDKVRQGLTTVAEVLRTTL